MTDTDLTRALAARIAACKTRAEAAVVYRKAMDSMPATLPSPWPQINAAIMKKWSRAGLLYIKEKAWKL